MTETLTAAGQITRFTATNGVTYGPTPRAAAWGSAGCPIVPRAYRNLHGELVAPKGMRDLARDRSLTLGYLDGGIWSRIPVDRIPGRLVQVMSRELGRLDIPSEAVAIPAGLPLAWVGELPVQSRTRSTIARLAESRGRGPLEQSMLVETIMDLRGVETTTVIDLLCVIESGELDTRALHSMGTGARRSRRLGPGRSGDTRAPRSTGTGTDRSCSCPPMTREQRCLSGLAAWALSETGAATLGDVLATLVGKQAAVSEWRGLAELRVRDMSEDPKHPYQVLDDWVSRLPERKKLIFTHRSSDLDDRLSLAELGRALGITRERVRQIAKKIDNELGSYAGTEAGRSIRWRIDSLRRRLGIAAPASRVDHALSAPPGSTDYSSLLLELAGPYVKSSGWLVLRSKLKSDPMPSILKMTDDFGRIDMAEGGRLLSRWGLDKSLHSAWLTRNGKVRIFGDRLVRWKGPIADKLAFALDEIGRPLSPEAIVEFIGGETSLIYVKNVLARNDRFVRVNITDYALTRWDLPEYRGVASAIRRLLEELGPTPIPDLLERLHTDFGTAGSTARAYCHAPAFVVEDGWVRIRREDEPYARRAVRGAAGVFGLGKGRTGLLLKVDQDVLRGSGRRMSAAAGNALSIQPNERLMFVADDGLSVTAFYLDTSIQGPMLGSTRVFAGSMGLELGDYLTLILDRTRMSVSATGTRLADHSPGWPLVSRLTGIDPSTGAEGLAAALDCGPGEVESALRSRGDHVVAGALPIDLE